MHADWARRLRRNIRNPPELFDLPHLLVFANRNIDPEDDPEGVAIANWAWYTTADATQKPRVAFPTQLSLAPAAVRQESVSRHSFYRHPPKCAAICVPPEEYDES